MTNKIYTDAQKYVNAIRTKYGPRSQYRKQMPDIIVTKEDKDGNEVETHRYLNLVAALDTEAISLEVSGKLYAATNVYMVAVEHVVFLSRDPRTLPVVLEMVQQALKLGVKTKTAKKSKKVKKVADVRLATYVHNLGYDFQFLRTLLPEAPTADSQFALASHKPVRYLTSFGVELRCSYILTNSPLEKLSVADGRLTSMPELPNQYSLYGKRTGSYDYNKIRHYGTPLTDAEMEYCVQDVLTLTTYIRQLMSQHGDTIASIPMTATGYVRRDVREYCLQDPEYAKLIKSLTLTREDYEQLHQLFQGGFTHAGAYHSCEIIGDGEKDKRRVSSYDVCSMYPTMICAKQFPMSKFESYVPKDARDLAHQLKTKCCVFRLTLHDVKPKLRQDNPISFSKLLGHSNDVELNNGRVVSASRITIMCNEVDYNIYKEFYDFRHKLGDISDMKVAEKGYLPKRLIECIVRYYQTKTRYKGVPGHEFEAAFAKANLNSVYGMMVMALIRALSKYDPERDEWIDKESKRDPIEKANKSKSRFLYYAWGVWVTAYARECLFGMIKAAGLKHCYSDTDSEKCIVTPEFATYVEDYNARIQQELEQAAIYHGMPADTFRATNDRGKVKPLGIIEYEDTYLRFKTLGAKRYVAETLDPVLVDEVDEDGPTGRLVESGVYEIKLHTTVAGVNKKALPAYLESLDGDPLENFDIGLHVEADATGKLIHSYIDRDTSRTMVGEVEVTDYLGNRGTVWSSGGVHLAPVEYEMSNTPAALRYLEYVMGCRMTDTENN